MIRTHSYRSGRARAGFTIIEIMVVIAIIAVLAGLGSAAFVKWIDSRRRDNTEQTIQTTYKLLQQQMKAVVDQADKEQLPSGVVTAAGNDRATALVFYKLARLAQQFP